MVTEISIKTGTRSNSQSDAVPTLEICDSFQTCCKTTDLDNTGNDRKNGKTDIYHNGRLGSCKQVASPHLNKTYILLGPIGPFGQLDSQA